jgi:Xaa-Pro aminopeptidase
LSEGASGVPRESLARLHRLLDASEADGLLVLSLSSSDPDLAPFVGAAHLGESFVLAPGGGRPLLGYLTDMERGEAAATGLDTLSPGVLNVAQLRAAGHGGGDLWVRVLRAAFAEAGLEAGRWAVAGHLGAGIVAGVCIELGAEGWAWRDGGSLVRRWRKFKPEVWMPRIERPATGVCAAMRAVAGTLARAEIRGGALWSAGEPLTVGVLRRRIARELAERELAQPHGNILACGADAAMPHSQGSSERVVQSGEALVVDLFPRGEMFADCTRTFCVGEPGRALAAAHAVVQSALEASLHRCRAGARGWDLQAQVCDAFEAAGHATPRTDPSTRVGYVHGLGHGVGFELHEDPSFRETAEEEGLLEVGDLLTLEPGLYDAEAGYGVRLEDLCYLSAVGTINLTPLPYALDPRAWE